MSNIRLKRVFFAAALLLAAALAGGCGGRASGGAAAQPPASPADRGALKLTNVPARTVITVDGQQQALASGTVIIQLAPGVHNVSVSRAGYIAGDSAGLAQTPVAINSTTEKALSFTREEIPLPGDWIESAGRVAGEVVSETPAPPPIP